MFKQFISVYTLFIFLYYYFSLTKNYDYYVYVETVKFIEFLRKIHGYTHGYTHGYI